MAQTLPRRGPAMRTLHRGGCAKLIEKYELIDL